VEASQSTYPFQAGPLGYPGHRVRTSPLTLDEMRAIIARGESVMWNDVVISDAAHLPTEAQMAVGDPEAEARAASHLEDQIARLRQDLSDLKEGRLAAPSSPGGGPVAPHSPPPDAGLPTRSGPPAQGEPVGVNEVLTESQKADLRRAQREALMKAKETAANEEPRNPPPVSGKNVP
jgi:hypothetical protein